MATIADIVIKKADAVTNITFTAVAGSAGDKIPAAWRSETAASYRGNRPVFTMATQDNGSKTARRANLKVVFPLARTVGGVEAVADKVILDVSILVPNALTDVEIGEAVSQSLNLLGATQIVAAIKAGIAPN